MFKRWRWVGLYILLIYITIPVGRYLTPLAAKLKIIENLIIIFSFVGLLLYTIYIKNLNKILFSIIIIIIFSYLIFSLKLPEERLHYIEYGILGFMIFKTLKNSSTKNLIYGITFVFAIGIIDEIIQYFLPNRVGDIRDIFMNLGGGALGLCYGKILSS